MTLYDHIAGLPLEIDTLAYEISSLSFTPEFTRRTTVVKLLGHPDGGRIGLGEDVTYDADEHALERLPALELRGSWTIASLSAELGRRDLFPHDPPKFEVYRNYRRWAFEAAALDLALAQAGETLGSLLGRSLEPVRFVSSTRASSLAGWLALYPSLRFKLDATPDWSDERARSLAAAGNVEVVDLKGAYHGTPVDNPPDGPLYRRVAELLPDVWIEDPALTPETDAVLAPHRQRITWDAPIHSWADVAELPFPPRCLNSKPSRFGTLAALFEFYERCAEQQIALYGGGQFELGVGRGQIQLLASLFHPDGPNDVAPGGYNASEPRPGLPVSPLPALSPAPGFRGPW